MKGTLNKSASFVRLRRRSARSGDSRWVASSSVATTPVALTIVLIAAGLLMRVAGFGRTAVECEVMLVAVVGLYSYSGVTGIASFGHVGFMAIGGYVATILTIPVEEKHYSLPGLPHALATLSISPYAALPIAWAAGVIFAGIFGLLVWRLNGLAASIASLMLLLILFTVASSWNSVTGGSGSVAGVPQIGSIVPPLIVGIIVVWITFAYQRSRFGRFAQAAREDEAAAKAVGIRIHFVRWTAMTLSGGAMAVGGALYVYFVGSISPQFFYVPLMFTLLTMLVIGGMLSMTGAVTGTIVVEVLQQILGPLDSGGSLAGMHWSGHPGARFVVLGLLMLVVLIRRPGGIVNGYEFRLPHPGQLRHTRDKAPIPTTSPTRPDSVASSTASSTSNRAGWDG